MNEAADSPKYSSEGVLYASAYEYRRAPVLIVSIVLLLICGPLLCRFAWECVRAYSTPEKLLIGVVPMAFLGLFLFIGGVLLRYYIIGHSLPLVIDRDGVRYGARFFAWQEIGALKGRSAGASIQLLLHRRGRIALDRHLLTNQGMTAVEYEALMMKLEAEIAPVYEHLSLG